ncbi:flavin reductase [Taibaiella sp. KBW10]|uniref:flavin reductase family protein n=1 Tax=Taibaiella sp. KBW10 TaxID=2153357 RepID=UPI000F59F76E|nr:flavin reductase family protein [Taibaiella sp. KBW10]RQO29850.1 flavin reductase [Taibaiella sp. KBW10]
MEILPQDISTKQLHAYLLGSIAPRPICFASTVDSEGKPNLSPFSFFNVFGSKPPICIFSPARRVRDNTIKDTLENVIATKEVVINVVSYAMVQQMSLASCEYPKGVSEFEKSGFTPVASTLVKPFRVKEAPVSLECKVLEVKAMGTEGGAANLIICEVVKMHIDDAILDENQQIDPHKIDLVARMGMDYYCRASGESVFEVPKPNLSLGIGIDRLPLSIKNSEVLSGNDLGILGNCTGIPIVADLQDDERLINILKTYDTDGVLKVQVLHQYAKELIGKGDLDTAWQVLLSE